MERDIQHAIRLASAEFSGLTLWRNSTGVADTANGTKQRFGLCKGSSDLIGILAPAGRLVAIEIKSETGRLRPEQELFLELVRKHGGFACVVRSVEEFREAMQRAIHHENS
jgi:hypothetical protein